MSSFSLWPSSLQFQGIALLFAGITLALTVIAGTLRVQARLLDSFSREASGNHESASPKPLLASRESRRAHA